MRYAVLVRKLQKFVLLLKERSQMPGNFFASKFSNYGNFYLTLSKRVVYLH